MDGADVRRVDRVVAREVRRHGHINRRARDDRAADDHVEVVGCDSQHGRWGQGNQQADDHERGAQPHQAAGRAETHLPATRRGGGPAGRDIGRVSRDG